MNIKLEDLKLDDDIREFLTDKKIKYDRSILFYNEKDKIYKSIRTIMTNKKFCNIFRDGNKFNWKRENLISVSDLIKSKLILDDDVNLDDYYLQMNGFKKIQIRINGKFITIARFILDVPDLKKRIKIIDGNPYNLRRDNLKIISNSEVIKNQSKRHINNGLVGYNKTECGGRMSCTIDKVNYSITVDSEIEAYRLYNAVHDYLEISGHRNKVEKIRLTKKQKEYINKRRIK